MKAGKLFKNEAGFILLETVVLAFLLMSLSGSLFFLQASAENRKNCGAKISAIYAMQQYIDNLIVFGQEPKNEDFVINNTKFHVTEEVRNLSTENNFEPNKLAIVEISWKIKGREYSIKQKRAWHKC